MTGITIGEARRFSYLIGKRTNSKSFLLLLQNMPYQHFSLVQRRSNYLFDARTVIFINRTYLSEGCHINVSDHLPWI